MFCAACGRPVEEHERDDAFCWSDPDGITCVAHGSCLDHYDDVLANFEVRED